MDDTTSHAVPCGSDSTSIALDRAAHPLGVTFVFAPGAGAHREHPSVLGLSQELCARGIDVVRFNFWYREQGKATPDRMSRLQACYESVADFAKSLLPGNRMVIGGRSMGGRVASMMVANRHQCDGLLLYAYPLLGATGEQRTQHLSDISVPTLCVCGTRDRLCPVERMNTVIASLKSNWRMHWIEGADHSFKVLKRSGRCDTEVIDEIASMTEQWMRDVTL